MVQLHVILAMSKVCRCSCLFSNKKKKHVHYDIAKKIHTVFFMSKVCLVYFQCYSILKKKARPLWHRKQNSHAFFFIVCVFFFFWQSKCHELGNFIVQQNMKSPVLDKKIFICGPEANAFKGIYIIGLAETWYGKSKCDGTCNWKKHGKSNVEWKKTRKLHCWIAFFFGCFLPIFAPFLLKFQNYKYPKLFFD